MLRVKGIYFTQHFYLYKVTEHHFYSSSTIITFRITSANLQTRKPAITLGIVRL